MKSEILSNNDAALVRSVEIAKIPGQESLWAEAERPVDLVAPTLQDLAGTIELAQRAAKCLDDSLQMYTALCGPVKHESESNEDHARRCYQAWIIEGWKDQAEALTLLTLIAERIINRNSAHAIAVAAINAVDVCYHAWLDQLNRGNVFTCEEATALETMIRACGENPAAFRMAHEANEGDERDPDRSNMRASQ